MTPAAGREIPACVLVPLRAARVGYRLAALIGVRETTVSGWLRSGHVATIFWQDFMAQAIALIETRPGRRPLNRGPEYREYRRRLVAAWRANLSPQAREQWREYHRAWQREYRERKKPMPLCEALRMVPEPVAEIRAAE